MTDNAAETPAAEAEAAATPAAAPKGPKTPKPPKGEGKSRSRGKVAMV